jgi:hypothetical protein
VLFNWGSRRSQFVGFVLPFTAQRHQSDATNEGISMRIETGNFEIELRRGGSMFLRWGSLQVWCNREEGQPFWWFAREEPGSQWQRWGFGRTLIVERVADRVGQVV